MEPRTTAFANWLMEQLRERDWRAADLARKGNVDSASLSRALSGERLPSVRVCKGIASALQITQIEVFYRAGILDEKPKIHDPYFENLSNLWSSLSNWKKRDLVIQARASVLNMEAELRMGTEPKSTEAHSDIDIIEKLHNKWGTLSEQQRRELVEFLRQVVAEQIRDKERLKTGGES